MARLGAFGVASAILFTMFGCGGLPSPDIVEYEHPIDGASRAFVMYLDSNALTAVSARESSGQVTFEAMLVARGQHDTVAPEGTPVDFRVGDEKHKWMTTVVARPTSNVFHQTVITQWRLVFTLTAEQARVLASGPLTAVRATLGADEFMLVLDEGQTTTLKRNMGVLSTPRRPKG